MCVVRKPIQRKIYKRDDTTQWVLWEKDLSQKEKTEKLNTYKHQQSTPIAHKEAMSPDVNNRAKEEIKVLRETPQYLSSFNSSKLLEFYKNLPNEFH